MFAALLLSLALSGQEPTTADRNCGDDNGVDRCNANVQAAVRTRLGIASIEEEAAGGVEAYRAFFVDGYGRDMPVISFERRPGESPKVVVYGFEGRKISGPLSAEVWRDIQSESLLADRVLQRPSDGAGADGQAGPSQDICLHSWVQTVEMSNTWPERWRVVPVRRRTEDACGGGLTTRFAFHLAELAVKALPPCEVLDNSRQRNRVTQLATCLNLKGDRLAAAELRNARLEFGLRPGADPANPYAWQAALGTNGSPRLVWAGEEVKTERGQNQNVAQFLVAKHAELPDLTFDQMSFEGIDARQAKVDGYASYEIDDVTWRANYRQTWVWDPSLLEWMLSDWVVDVFTSASTR